MEPKCSEMVRLQTAGVYEVIMLTDSEAASTLNRTMGGWCCIQCNKVKLEVLEDCIVKECRMTGHVLTLTIKPLWTPEAALSSHNCKGEEWVIVWAGELLCLACRAESK